MMKKLEALFTPADFQTLPQRDLREIVCVVFDILRATTSMITALAHGAEAIIPVAEIQEALHCRQRDPHLLLAGERHGLRIRGDQAHGVEFDFGNSPREFVREKVSGRQIAMTTTNGTRALRACARARTVLPASFLNLEATARWLEENAPPHLILICSGTFEEAAYEDVLAAGALADRLSPAYAGAEWSDAAMMCRQLYVEARHDLVSAIRRARNGRRLLADPDLRDDVAFCLQRDTLTFPAVLNRDGTVTKMAARP